MAWTNAKRYEIKGAAIGLGMVGKKNAEKLVNEAVCELDARQKRIEELETEVERLKGERCMDCEQQ